MLQRYLLEALENTFIQLVDAHHDISFACIAYLRTSLCLIDPHLPEEQRTVRVRRGFHALQLYAHEHWATHLLAYLNLSSGFEREASQPLMEQLTNLCKVHKQMEAQLSRSHTARELHTRGDNKQGLHYLSNAEERELVQATLGLWKLLNNKQRKSGKGIFYICWVSAYLFNFHPIEQSTQYLIS
jgi:hypothetical protein